MVDGVFWWNFGFFRKNAIHIYVDQYQRLLYFYDLSNVKIPGFRKLSENHLITRKIIGYNDTEHKN